LYKNTAFSFPVFTTVAEQYSLSSNSPSVKFIIWPSLISVSTSIASPAKEEVLPRLNRNINDAKIAKAITPTRTIFKVLSTSKSLFFGILKTKNGKYIKVSENQKFINE